MNLLLVDDHIGFLQTLQKVLIKRGFDVIGTAHNGLEAVEQARRLHPDVILMDIHMPVMDGIAATRKILAEQPDIQIVIITATEDATIKRESASIGAKGCLGKNMGLENIIRFLNGLSLLLLTTYSTVALISLF